MVWENDLQIMKMCSCSPTKINIKQCLASDFMIPNAVTELQFSFLWPKINKSNDKLCFAEILVMKIRNP